MSKKATYSIILSIGIILLHSMSVVFGWYEQGIRVDLLQHAAAGIVFVLLWQLLLQKEHITIQHTYIFFLAAIGFVTLLAVAWEVFEFGMSSLLPRIANSFKWYSPTVGEMLGDVVASMLGATIYILYVQKNTK